MKNGSQYIFEENIRDVGKTLRSSIICSGPQIINFEIKLRNYLNSKYVTVCSSGTAALHLAFLSLNIKKNDIVIVPNINFIASFNMLTEIGAKIIICDTDKYTGQICLSSLSKILSSKKNIKALITMYLGGVPKNIDKLIELKKKYQFIVIEDSCHAFGSNYEYRGNEYMIGSCKYFECSIFSFHALKTITTGEGGAISFKYKNTYNKSKILRSHGIVKKNHWNYDVIYKGYNYRMDEISATLGKSQLKNIGKIIKKRRKLSLLYNKILNNSSELLSTIFSDNEIKNSSCHLYFIKVNFKKTKIDKLKLINAFIKKKILLHSHYKPISQFSYIKANHSQKISLAQSKEYFDNSITLPLYYEMTYDNVKTISELLINYLNEHKLKNVR